jgi:CheY-like chemotaxis protein
MNLETIIVDDDPIVIYLHKVMLADGGVCNNPSTAYDGEQALNHIIHSDKKNCNYLVFLDINMPIMNGWEFLDAIQTLPFSNQIFVVMATSSLDSSDREKSHQYHQVIGFAEKPLNEETCKKIKALPELAAFFTT